MAFETPFAPMGVRLKFSDVRGRIIMLLFFFNLKNRSSTSETCHQNVSNIPDVTSIDAINRVDQ